MDRWVTYREGGELFGMSAEAFRQRARRERWRTQPANDGKRLVLVPEGLAVRPRVRPPAQTDGQTPEQSSAINALTDLLRAEHEALRADLQAEREARVRADERADRAETRLQEAEERARAAEIALAVDAAARRSGLFRRLWRRGG